MAVRKLYALFVRFFRLGAFTIGGGLVMLGIIEAEMSATGEFSDEEIADMLVLATTVPGPIATNLAFLAGKKTAGFPGALTAVVGTTVAPFLCILFLSGLIMDYLENHRVLAFFMGATAGIVVLVGNSMWNLIRMSVLKGLPQIAAFLATAGLVIFGNVHPLVGLAVGGAISLWGECVKDKKASVEEKHGKKNEGKYTS